MSEPCPDCGLPVLVLDGRQVRLPGSCRCEPVPSADEPGGVPEAADPEAAAVLEVAALGADDDEGWPPPEDEPPGDDAAGPGGLADHPGLAAIAAKYTPVDWGTAWKNQPEEVQWLIEPILEAGTVNVLFAKVDTGKSLLALELSLRLVRDGHTVVYVDEENRVTDVVDRLKAFGAEPGELDRLLFFSYAALPSLDTVTGGVHLLALAVAAGAEPGHPRHHDADGAGPGERLRHLPGALPLLAGAAEVARDHGAAPRPPRQGRGSRTAGVQRQGR